MAKKPKNDPVTPDETEDVINLHEAPETEAELEQEIEKLAEAVEDAPKEKTDEKPAAESQTGEASDESEEFDNKAHQGTAIGDLAQTKPAEGPDPENEFADEKTTKAVDDIVAKESDELMAAEDEARDQVLAKKPQKKGGFKDWLSRYWENPAAKWGTITGLGLLLLLVIMLPVTRYFVLNTFGVRANSSVKVIDRSTRQPLKNVSVVLQGQEQLTDQEGMVRFSRLKLGKSQLVIKKRGFAEINRYQTLGWGSNPLGDSELTAVGTQFAFKLTDFLSKQPVKSAEAITGEFSAQANEKGEISLVVDKDVGGDIEVEIKAEGYRAEKVKFSSTDTAEKSLEMTAGLPQVFVSKRSGKYEVFKIDADGKNETKLLAATGKERDDMALSSQPTGNVTALVSTRDGVRNRDGYLLSGLFIIDVATGNTQKIAEDERIQIVDWQGDYLLYVLVDEGGSAANPKRSRLVSYDVKTGSSKELATANYFNDVYAVRGAVYYAPSSYSIAVSSVKFYKVSPDGSSPSTLLDKEVWSIARGDYDTLHLSVGSDWYELKLGGTSVTKMTSPPASLNGLSFEDSADRSKALWVDSRDGKGVLLIRTVADSTDKTLQTKAGLSGPLRWLNATTVSYRIVSSDETADYVMSTEGGEPRKVVDVTNTGSAESFFYY